MSKIKKITKKCNVWKWNLYSLELEWKKWDYALISKSEKIGDIMWSVAIWIDKNNNITLIKNYRHGLDKISWEIPRWWAEQGLSWEENALKEFQEEIGILDNPKEIKKLWKVAPDDGIIGWYLDLVLLKYEDFSKYDVWWEKDGSYEDIYEVKYFSMKDFEQMIKDGTITDGYTISAYAYLVINKII